MSEAVQGVRAGGEARPAARLGAELRAARQRLGWELPDLAGSLRIRQSYLEAIENGRMAELPGTTYALGFVRTYASALGLSGEEVAGRFRAEAEEVQQKPALSFPAPVPQRGVPAGALMLVGLIILAGAYGGWYYFSEHQHTVAETVPPIPDRLLPLTQPATPKPSPSPQVASILPSTTPPSAQPPGPPAALPAPQTAPAVTSAPKSAAVTPAGPGGTAYSTPADTTTHPATTPTPSQAAPVTSSPAAGPAAGDGASQPPGTAPSAAALPAGTRVVIKTTADAWVTVKQKNGPAIVNKLMHAGDSVPLPADKTDLTLTTGNAGGTEVDVDGTAVESIGASGMVRRDLPLDPATLKAGHFPAIFHGHSKPHAAAAPAPAGDTSESTTSGGNAEQGH